MLTSWVFCNANAFRWPPFGDYFQISHSPERKRIGERAERNGETGHEKLTELTKLDSRITKTNSATLPSTITRSAASERWQLSRAFKNPTKDLKQQLRLFT